MPIEPRRTSLLGITFRPLQAEAFGLEVDATLAVLLNYPIQIVRLGAYWDRIEPEPGRFDIGELDRHIDMVEQSDAKIVMCVGALKTYGFPEYFIPRHIAPHMPPDGTVFTPEAHPELLAGACEFIVRIVHRYKHRQAIVAWQLENEPLDPIPFAHNWRLSRAFLAQELSALHAEDSSRPVSMNGFSSASPLIKLGHTWMTRDDGTSLNFAKSKADIVGVDYYPRVAGLAVGKSRAVYVDSTRLQGELRHHVKLLAWAKSHNRRLMVTEAQAEPWELSTVPPSPPQHGLYSCNPQGIITTYNKWMQAARISGPLYAYLFWGAEYWVHRQRLGNPHYLQAFARVINQ